MKGSAWQGVVRFGPWAGVVLLFLVFLKNAWACDDAYITFRSIEQLFAGNGPRWNPHERVQVFTSPLWFWILSAVRTVSADVFLNAIAASAAFFVATLLVLRRVVRHDYVWLAVMFVLVASNGFFDYTSSGLENPLSYLVLSLFLLSFFHSIETGRDAGEARRHVRGLLFFAGLALLCRLDHLTLVLPPLVYAIDRNRGLFDRRGWWATGLLAAAPLVAWSLFALVYYGSPLPNPAYAKLWTGIAPTTLWRMGILYIGAVAVHDAITVALVAGGAVAMLRSRRDDLRVIAVAILLNVAYVVSVGGDFMLGRFLSHAVLFAAVGLGVLAAGTRPGTRRRLIAAVVTFCALYWFAFPHTPVNSPLVHLADPPDQNGFADERGIYNRASLWRWVHRGLAPTFPNTKWAMDGLVLRETPTCCVFAWSMGFYGYWAGTEKRIVDLFAICDPLLARLPVTEDNWRIGHYPRRLPEGYLLTIHHGTNYIEDPEMHRFYDTVWLVTQSDDLWSPARWRAIVAFNLPR